MLKSGIVAVGSLRQYFAEAVCNALELLRFQPSQQSATYLVELLLEYARATASPEEQPLALVMAEAQLADPATSIRGLKRVGDHSLVLAGYFTARLLSRQLDPSYYVLLGGGAYRQLSRTLKRSSSQAHLVVVYRELGEEFARFAEVLHEVRSQGEPASQVEGEAEAELGEAYLHWLQTGSERARRRLQAAGILVLRRPASR